MATRNTAFDRARIVFTGGSIAKAPAASLAATSRANLSAMEFANLTLIFVTAWLVWKKPEKERVAFAMLVTSVALMAFLFFLATRSSILPPANY